MSAAKAAEDLKLLARKFKPLLDAAEALEKIGSIENAAKEADVRLMKSKSEAKLAADQAEIEKEKLYAVQEEVESAKKQAMAIVGQANDKANQIMVKANEDAKMSIASANVEVKLKRDEVKQLEFEKLSVAQKIEEATKELQAIKNQIADLKLKIAAFVK